MIEREIWAAAVKYVSLVGFGSVGWDPSTSVEVENLRVLGPYYFSTFSASRKKRNRCGSVFLQ